MRTTLLSLILLASLVAALAKPNHHADHAPEAEIKENSMDAPPMMPAPADPGTSLDSDRKGKFLWTVGGYPYAGGLQPISPGIPVHNRWGWIWLGK